MFKEYNACDAIYLQSAKLRKLNKQAKKLTMKNRLCYQSNIYTIKVAEISIKKSFFKQDKMNKHKNYILSTRKKLVCIGMIGQKKHG